MAQVGKHLLESVWINLFMDCDEMHSRGERRRVLYPAWVGVCVWKRPCLPKLSWSEKENGLSHWIGRIWNDRDINYRRTAVEEPSVYAREKKVHRLHDIHQGRRDVLYGIPTCASIGLDV